VARSPLVVEIERLIVGGAALSPDDAAGFRDELSSEISRRLAGVGAAGGRGAYWLAPAPISAGGTRRQLAAQVAERVAGVIRGQLK
jgi:hypothetical protein